MKHASLAEDRPDLAEEWHPTKNGNLTPRDVSSSSNMKVWWRHWHERTRSWHEWRAVVNSRFHGSGCPYCSNHRPLVGYNDLETRFPEVAAEWHPEKNGDLKPFRVVYSSRTSAWWRCELGHEWEAPVSNRAKGQGCPYCSGRKVLPGFNDLATQNPDLAAEWHPDKNGDLTPQDVTPGSKLKAWWRCGEGHDWRATVDKRVQGQGCPYCSGRNVLPGFNDLATRNPELAAEWHPTKNGDLTPGDVLPGSTKMAWWRCELGHEWGAPVSRRTNGYGCPYCSNRKVLPGFNDLATRNPELAAEWHPTKNGDLTPHDVTPGSSRKVWWRCGKGHEWCTTVDKRTNGCGCPYCSGRKAVSGFNDLASRNPKLAAQWHPTKNGSLTPEDVTAGSARSVWWLGECGHEWRTSVAQRAEGCGCPYCSGRRVLPGFNDLATRNPKLAAEWHPTKNGGMTPQDVTAGSGKRVWWLGKCGHEWMAPVGRRGEGWGCPYCSGRKVLPGFNDLASRSPTIAAQWNYEKNGDLTPHDVTAQSGKVVWWKGECGHEWRAAVGVRAEGPMCPVCYSRGRGYDSWVTKERTSASRTPPKLVCDLAKVRKKERLSQSDLARLIGVERGTVAAIENGKSTPTVGLALVMADVLDVDVGELFHVVKGGYRMIDLTNERFGALVAKRRLPEKRSSKDTSVVWACLCDCGTYVEARAVDLRKGKVVDCGCGLGRRDRKGGEDGQGR